MTAVKWIKRILLGLFFFLFALAVLLLLYEQLQRVLADRNYPRPGQLIDVGGHDLHALIKGQGSPTVVFESGLGIDGHLSWYKVQDTVSEFARTLSYDRAGVMWSERGDNPKTPQAISEELARLLDNGDIEPPYILVGHSLAGITLRPFISTHREDIAGIVFVDVSHPDQVNRYPEEMSANSDGGPPSIVLQLMRSFGVLRYLISNGQQPTSDPSDIYSTVVPTMIHRSLGVQDEGENVENIAAGAAGITDFGDIPLVVITGAIPTRNDNMPYSQEVRDELTTIWNTMQEELLQLSTNSRRVLALESGHYVQISEPEIVIEAIRSLVDDSRE